MITLFNIEIPDLSNTPMSGWLVIAVAALAGMALTTLYPVFILMAHQPRAIFRQQKGNTGRIVSFALTTFQYSAAVVLVLWVSVVFFQLDFILHKDLGFDRANVAIINVPATGSAASEERFVSLMNTLRSRYQATYGQTLMGDDEHMRVKMKSPKQRDYFQVDSNGGVDETFVPFFGLRVLAGRNFIQGDRADALIVGRYVANRLGYPNPEDAIGAKIQVENKESTLLEVIGVIEDFSLRPFVNYGEDTGHPNKTRDDGVILSYKNGSWPEMVPGKIAIRLSPKNFQADVKDLGEMFSRYFPNAMFTWTLHEDHINRQYNQEKVLGGQTSLLAAVAIGIACLGLIGMISNTVEEKTKELGIRKVFGAGLTKVASVLLKPTIRQLLIAIIAGLPIGLYLGTQYLERYSLRVALQWWHLAIPLSILILTMVAAVAYSLFNAVRANPVDSLRCE